MYQKRSLGNGAERTIEAHQIVAQWLGGCAKGTATERKAALRAFFLVVWPDRIADTVGCVCSLLTLSPRDRARSLDLFERGARTSRGTIWTRRCNLRLLFVLMGDPCDDRKYLNRTALLPLQKMSGIAASSPQRSLRLLSPLSSPFLPPSPECYTAPMPATVALTLRLPPGLYDQLQEHASKRRRAKKTSGVRYQRNAGLSSVVREALYEYLEKRAADD